MQQRIGASHAIYLQTSGLSFVPLGTRFIQRTPGPVS
jgi:hypothetical protein